MRTRWKKKNLNKDLNEDESKGEKSGLHAQQSASDAKAEMERTKAWERLERLINELHDYANPRPNVHKEIKKKIDNIGSAFKRLKTLEGVRVTQQHATFVAPQAVGTPKTPDTLCSDFRGGYIGDVGDRYRH